MSCFHCIVGRRLAVQIHNIRVCVEAHEQPRDGHVTGRNAVVDRILAVDVEVVHVQAAFNEHNFANLKSMWEGKGAQVSTNKFEKY